MIEAEPQSYDRVLSSMCTDPHPSAVAAANRFLGSNPGDPATFPAIADLESRAIDLLGEITGIDTAHGYIASGGTEANIQAMHVARNCASVESPTVIVPESAHVSFHKAAELLDVTIEVTPVDENGQADVDAMRERVGEETIMVVGVAGTTEYGRVDPIPEIAELAATYDVHCHVDAAWGGFFLPFTDYSWNFADAAIDSLTIDPHKVGRAAIPAGGFLVRAPAMLDAVRFDAPYLEDGSQPTLGGTRSGAGVASTVAVLSELWPDTYRHEFERCMGNATWLADALSERGFDVVAPELPLVVADVSERTFTALRDHGWRISRTRADELRIVCMPHVTREQLSTFLDDVDVVRESAITRGQAGDS